MFFIAILKYCILNGVLLHYCGIFKMNDHTIKTPNINYFLILLQMSEHSFNKSGVGKLLQVSCSYKVSRSLIETAIPRVNNTH